MTEEYTIQCENCGTLYPDTHEVCPYCGEPQPMPETYYDGELPPEPEISEELYPRRDNLVPDEAHPPPESEPFPAEAYPADEPFADDDIFAIAREEPVEDEYVDEYDEYDDEYDEAYDEYDDEYEEDEFDELEAEPRRRVWPRLLLGCLGMLLCIGLFYGGIGLFAIYQGLQERTSDIEIEAQEHYQRGQEHLANNELDLAIAEFELALKLNPNLHAAREALHEAERIAQSQPTPTSETRRAAAASLLDKAQGQITQESWAEAAETLSRLKDLDPEYEPERVSDLLYQTNYQLGLQLITPDQIDQAMQAFEQALAEHPDDEAVKGQITKASLYVEGKTAVEQNDVQKAIKALQQLYRQDNNYLDVKQQLLAAYVQFGDELADQEDWCQAADQYVEAILLQPDNKLKAKSDQSTERCLETTDAQATGTSRPPSTSLASGTSTTGADSSTDPEVTATDTPTATVSTGQGKILYSAFNPNESRWEVLSVPASGGISEVLAINATMPALSPDGQLLIYHSELIEAEGFHILDLTTGEDNRITLLKQHILPRWGGDSKQFLFVAEEAGTQRWQIHQGFADGQSDPPILRDGRTVDWSADNSTIAFQGSDPDGNNPGIYLMPFGGGEATRLTNHESDRAPNISPDGTQLAFMSTRNGNWDVYIVNTAGSAPRQMTTAPGQDGLPVWAPSGAQIAYVSDADGSWGIYVVDVEEGTPVKISAWDGNRPDWLLAQIWWAR